MRRMWRRLEGPTWLVALAIYGGWIALALGYRHLPLAFVWPVAVYLVAWHSSLQHETIHGLRGVSRTVRTSLASPPLGVWFPYETYRVEHLRHHATRDLAGRDDPERFSYEPETWSRMNGAQRAIASANQTLAGRLAFGPALQIGRTYAGGLRRLRGGDASLVPVWLAHLAMVGGLLWLLSRVGIDPVAYVVCVAYPAASLGLVRSFAEHRDADSPRERTAIVESGGALALLFLNNNLHAVHHRYPALPWFELSARYRAGREREWPEPIRGYRTVARSWLLRPIGSPVTGGPALEAIGTPETA